MRIFSFAAFFIFMFGCACNNIITFNSPNINKRLASGVVLITKHYIARDSITLSLTDKKFSATGFSIFTENNVSYILTNQHVCNMKDVGEYMITTISGKKAEAKFVRVDAFADLCVLRAPIQIPALELAENNASVGERVMTIGAPTGVSPLFVEGMISGYYDIHMKNDPDEDGNFEVHFRCQITSIPIYPGASGSPVFDANGKVIGIVFATRIGAEHVSFIVPISEVKRFVEHVDYVNTAE